MNKEIFFADLRKIGFDVEHHVPEKLDRYYHELIRWNKRINLVSRKKENAIYEEFFYDSLAPLFHGFIKQGSRCIDVGSGAGFPGLVLGIFMEASHFTLVEATRKKVLFLKHLVALLGLSNVDIVQTRVEDMEKDEKFAQTFQHVFFKAFGSISKCLSTGDRLVTSHGTVIMYKGQEVTKEIEDAINSYPQYCVRIVNYELPDRKNKRQLIAFSKSGQ